MLKRFFRFLYGDIPVRFSSDFSLTESVARLREGTKRTVFSSFFRQAAVGPVTESRVHLQRVIPFVRNGFNPIVVGTFHHNDGRVVLDGRFTMLLFSKIFMTVWLAFALVWTVLATFAMLQLVGNGRTDEALMTSLFPVIGVGFFAAGIGFVRFCWWLSSNDMAFLASVIQDALSRETSHRRR